MFCVGTLESLEEEFHHAIATNIVQELLYRIREREKVETEVLSPTKGDDKSSQKSSPHKSDVSNKFYTN